MSNQPTETEPHPHESAGCPYAFDADDFDVSSPRHVSSPFDFYRRLRSQQPVFASAQLDSHVLSRYSDIRNVFLDHQSFSSVGSLAAAARIDPHVERLLTEHNATLETFLASVDQPLHTRLRRSVARSFSVRSMARLEPDVRAHATEMIEELLPRGQADFVSEFASLLPARITARFLGIPSEDTEKVQQWVDDWFGLFFTPMSVREQRVRAEGYIEYVEYMYQLLAKRRARPQDDFMSETLAAVADGTADLTDREIVEIMTAISLGGNDTTGNQVASLVYRLMVTPGAWDTVVRDSALRPNAVEESIRLDSAGIGGFRFANADVEIGGVTIPKGARLFLLQDSANHDETMFENPDEYVLDRPNAAENIGFGVGIHHCLGAPLARLELRVVLDVLTEHVPTLRLADSAPPTYRVSVVQRAMDSLPVAWDISK
ncbi:cytochrome P450 [Rhodococcus sp. WAY2]|uniref:cytochrome P450 n=1 Tax=Rhodococcus sp. WAY2 TaxID=2663121 RepID=UPI00131FAF39|nr:cytochrome P450 [Rhodococcus sp. WAY2]QHE68435.1 putative cytochrome P450 hydroxylase [Rhodococcus sp. WAY2]